METPPISGDVLWLETTCCAAQWWYRRLGLSGGQVEDSRLSVAQTGALQGGDAGECVYVWMYTMYADTAMEYQRGRAKELSVYGTFARAARRDDEQEAADGKGLTATSRQPAARRPTFFSLAVPGALVHSATSSPRPR